MLITENLTLAEITAEKLSAMAAMALIEEVNLSPKPGLVDRINNGTHKDLTLQLMETSAHVLQDCFKQMAEAAWNKEPTQALREQLAAIGRYGEQAMLNATGNINTHKGAIWALGLLTAAASLTLSQRKGSRVNLDAILSVAGQIASFDDRYLPVQNTNGTKVRIKYSVRSAREEAALGFPSIANNGIPAWDKYNDLPSDIQRLQVLLAYMSVVDDTCILHRSDMQVLKNIQHQAQAILGNGGLNNIGGWLLFDNLDDYVTRHWVSPGGSADLLAATIYLQKIKKHF